MPRYEEHACADCGKIRRVQMRSGVPASPRCHPCGAKHRVEAKAGSWASRERHPRWKGGRHVTTAGYVQIVVPVDDPMIVMADVRGRVYEHRLVVARLLGRPLLREEQVHHRNGDKQDNRLANLELASLPEHAAHHRLEVLALRARVQELERELREAQAAPT